MYLYATYQLNKGAWDIGVTPQSMGYVNNFSAKNSNAEVTFEYELTKNGKVVSLNTNGSGNFYSGNNDSTYDEMNGNDYELTVKMFVNGVQTPISSLTSLKADPPLVFMGQVPDYTFKTVYK